jgi:CHAT domain-containing protein
MSVFFYKVNLNAPSIKEYYTKMKQLSFFSMFICLCFIACQQKTQPKKDFSNDPQGLRIDSLVGIIKGHIGKGLNGELSGYAEAIRLCDSVMEANKPYLQQDSLRMAELFHRLGVAYRGKSNKNVDFEKSNTNFEQAVNIREKILPDTNVDLANSYLQWGALFVIRNQYSDAKRVLEKSEKILNFNKFKPNTQTWTVDVALKLGISLIKLDEFNYGQIRIKNAIDYLTKNSNDQYRLGMAYRYLSEGYINEPDSAIKYLKFSIFHLEESKNYNESIFCKIYLGYILLEKKRFNYAVNTLNDAISSYKTKGNVEFLELSKLYDQLGLAYTGLKQYDKAIYYGKEKALGILLKLPYSSEVQRAIYATQANLAEAYAGKKDYQKALEYYHAALKTTTLSQNNDPLSCPTASDFEQTYYKNVTTIALLSKARTLKTMAEQNPKNYVQYAQAALAHYEGLATLKALVRRDLWSDESKFLLNQNQDWLNEALTIAHMLYEKTGDLTQQQRAFYLAQQAKAQLILEHYQGEHGKLLSNVPDALQAQERVLESKIANLRKQISDEPNDKTLNPKLLEAESDLRAFIAQLEKDYPLYHQIKYDNHPISIAQLQSRLPKDMALIEYLPCGNQLHSFVVTTKGMQWYQATTTSKDSAAAQQLSDILTNADSISTQSEKRFLLASHQLYNVLLSPLQASLQGIKRLKIIPAGWLYGVNFETLLQQPYNEGKWSDKNVPYLIRNYAISYQFSSKEFLFQQNSKSGNVSVGSFGVSYEDENTRNSLRGVTCDFFDRTRGGGKLLYAVREAKQVETMWGSGDCYLDQEASKQKFINSCAEYDILHLALHGVIDCKNPDMTELVFGKKQQNEDNIMRLYEIAGLKMRCDLAVLSACHSGYGRLEGYEGVLSLGRAFAMAGCHSLITSNSYVVDDTSPQIFQVFYTHLKNQEAKDLALQASILYYLDEHEGYLRLPYRWSNFHLWGNTDTIQGTGKSNTNYWIWGFGVLTLLSLGFITWKRLKSSNSSKK